MLTIIEVAPREDGGHGLQSQSGRTECWLEGWVTVPEELVDAVWACSGYCKLEFNDNNELISITPTEKPTQPDPEPTAEERLEAQVTYTAMMTDTLLEVVE